MGPPHPESASCQVLRAMGLVTVEIKRFLFVTWLRYWSVTWLCGWDPLILSHQPAKFGVHRPCKSKDIKLFDLSRDHVVDVSWATTLQRLGSVGLVKVEIYCFWFATWPRDRCVTRFCKWDPIILSHYPAQFGVHRPCESGDITFFICHVTVISKCRVTLWVGSPHPKSPHC